MTTTVRVNEKKRSQGRPLLAFISTLDGVFNALIIEPGWKRSAFAFG
jgi:hypothetical protein